MAIRQSHAVRVDPRTNREAEPVRIHVVGEIGQVGWIRLLAQVKERVTREPPTPRVAGIVEQRQSPATTPVSGSKGAAAARERVHPGRATTRAAGIAVRGL